MNKELIIRLKCKNGALFSYKVDFNINTNIKKGQKITYWDIDKETVFNGTIKEVEENKEYFTLKITEDNFYNNEYIHISQLCNLIKIN